MRLPVWVEVVLTVGCFALLVLGENVGERLGGLLLGLTGIADLINRRES